MPRPIVQRGSFGRDVVAVCLSNGTWVDIDPGSFQLAVVDVVADDGTPWMDNIPLIRFTITGLPPERTVFYYAFRSDGIIGVKRTPSS